MALFWSNVWNDKVLKLKYPRLFSFAMDVNLSVRDVMQTQDRTELFHLPLSQQAFEEFELLQVDLGNFVLEPRASDVWKTIWKDGTFSSNRYYKHCFKEVVSNLCLHMEK